MQTLKRFTTSLIARVDRTLATIDDHAAIVDAAIRETGKAAAKAQFKLNKLRANTTQLSQQIDSLKVESERWETRALSVADSNREEAIQCISERKKYTNSIASLSQQLNQQQQIENQVAQTVQQLTDKVAGLKSKRSQFASREAAAQAQNLIQNLEGDFQLDLGETLERWEEAIYETEAETGLINPLLGTSDLAARFDASEQQQALEQELDKLMGMSQQSHTQNQTI